MTSNEPTDNGVSELLPESLRQVSMDSRAVADYLPLPRDDIECDPPTSV
jgi:hypothetical protein